MPVEGLAHMAFISVLTPEDTGAEENVGGVGRLAVAFFDVAGDGFVDAGARLGWRCMPLRFLLR